MNRLFIALCLIIAAASARADVTGLISNLIVAAATESELDETVISENILVVNASDYHDLRVGDGLTPGGVRICRTDALTAPPPSYPYSLSMNGNAINLNGSYAIGAEGPLWYLRCNGSNVISVLANAASLGSILSRAVIDADTLRIIVGVEDSALDPLVQYSPSILLPVWTDCVYVVSRPTPNTVQLDIEIPEDTLQGYYKITALSGFRARLGIPLEAPLATIGDGITIGRSGREITRDTTTDALLLAGGDAWNTGAMFELGGDAASGDVAGGSAQLLLKDSASGFKIRRREDWSTLFSVDQSGMSIAGATFRVSGTNLLLIINAVTNLVNLTPQ